MQEGGQRPPPHAITAAGRANDRPCACGAHGRCHERQSERDEQHRGGEEQRRPCNASDRQKGERRDPDVPLGSDQQGRERAAGRRIQRLEEGRAPGTVVDSPPAEPREQASRVKTAGPSGPPSPVLVGPLALQQRLGPSVLALLAPVRAHGAAGPVPDHGRGAEPEHVPRLEQLPADVDIVSGDAELGIETAHVLECPLTEGHVAPGKVLGLAVGDQHVNRRAGSVREAAACERRGARRHVWAAYAGIVVMVKGGNEIAEPVTVGLRVVVEVGDHVSGGGLHTDIPRPREAAILRLDHAHLVLSRDRGRRVRRAVVHHDHLEVRILDLHQRLQARAQRPLAVEGADHDRNSRPAARGLERRAPERGAHRAQGGLGPAVPARESKVPVVDLLPALGGGDIGQVRDVPVVGPREHERARAAGGQRGPDLPVQHGRLLELTVGAAVDTDLRHDERQITAEVVKPRDVRLVCGAGLEVHVEAREVEERKLQVLGRRVVDVRDEPARVLGLGGAVEARYMALHPPPSEPPNDLARDLVADRVTQDRGMSGARGDPGADAVLDRSCSSPTVEEIDVLLPRDTRHHEQPVLSGRVEQPPRRDRVRAHGVQSALRHLGEVSGDDGRGRVRLPVSVRTEGAIGHAAHGVLLLADEEELASHARARSAYGRRRRQTRSIRPAYAVSGQEPVRREVHRHGRSPISLLVPLPGGIRAHVPSLLELAARCA